MTSAAVGRALALAISFLLLGVTSGNAGHALAGLGGRGPESAVPALNALSDASGSAPPHDVANCPLCSAARVSSAILGTSAAGTAYIAEYCGAMSLPETLIPSTPRRRPEAARAPPARLFV
jgi:hypothetical protein